MINYFKIKNELILHTDRGAEFLSKEYHKFIQSNNKLIGSMSNLSTPTDNSPIERFFRTFKNQLNEEFVSIRICYFI